MDGRSPPGSKGKEFISRNPVLCLHIREAVCKKFHTSRRLCDVTMNSLASRLPVDVQLILHQFQGHSTVSGCHFAKNARVFEGLENLPASQSFDQVLTLELVYGRFKTFRDTPERRRFISKNYFIHSVCFCSRFPQS